MLRWQISGLLRRAALCLDCHGTLGEVVEDPVQVFDRREFDGDPPLGQAHVDLDPGVEPVREAARELIELFCVTAAAGTPCTCGGVVLPDRHGFLDLPNGEALRYDTLGEALHRRRIREPEQGAGVSRRENAGRHPTLHERG